jgi:allantoinase
MAAVAKSSFDLLIEGGTVVAAGRQSRASVGVRDGKIAALLAPDEPVPSAVRIDARKLHVFPGLVDPHVQTGVPGVETREDFASATAAAAAGGITTLFEMPVSPTPGNSGPNLDARRSAMAPQAHIDFALYGGAGRDSVETILAQARAGAIAFKTFLQPPPTGREAEYRGLWCRHDEIRTIMDAVRLTSLRHCFHCEDPGVFGPLQARFEALGRTTGRALAEARPAGCEEVSVAVVLARAAERPLPIGIVHCSSPLSARLAADARLRGLNVTVEACVPHLFATIEALDTHGPFAACLPPLRPPYMRDELWYGIQGGLIEYCGSAHTPFRAADKHHHGEDIFRAPPGIASLDLYMPLLLTAAHQRRISLPQIAAVCSENPAFVFRLPNKGRMVVGADADFTIVDTRRRWRFDASKAHSRSRDAMRLWDGYKLKGAVVATIVRGQPVYRDGELVGAPGYGRFQRPNLDIDGGRPIEGAMWGAGPL